MYRNTGIQ
ncbi:hypothetical protein D039_4161A, partial [Vibrio parahaemolyticus EKP-028]